MENFWPCKSNYKQRKSQEVARDIIKKGLSVEVEKILKKSKKSNDTIEVHEYLDIEDELSSKIELKLKLTMIEKNGSLTIKFKSLDQLDFIIKKLKRFYLKINI